MVDKKFITRNLALNQTAVPKDGYPIEVLVDGEAANYEDRHVTRQSNTDMKGENLVRIQKQLAPTENGSPQVEKVKGDPLALTRGKSIKSKVDSEEPDNPVDKDEVAAAAPEEVKTSAEPEPKGTADRESKKQASPSRTDTEFFEGKKPNTERKPQAVGTASIGDKQLSEDAQSKTSPKGAPTENLNYHTTAEDAGEAYFPQILKYTENAPQESILSRDNYSTSNHPSMISQPPRKLSRKVTSKQPSPRKEESQAEGGSNANA